MNALRCPVVELRQYTLHPGRRDVLVDLFDREFVESQEAVGATVLGQFRDPSWGNSATWTPLTGSSGSAASKTCRAVPRP